MELIVPMWIPNAYYTGVLIFSTVLCLTLLMSYNGLKWGDLVVSLFGIAVWPLLLIVGIPFVATLLAVDALFGIDIRIRQGNVVRSFINTVCDLIDLVSEIKQTKKKEKNKAAVAREPSQIDKIRADINKNYKYKRTSSDENVSHRYKS